MSAEPSDILEAARMLVARQLDELRALVEEAHRRSKQLSNELRQAERIYDEAKMQYRFVAEQQLPSAEVAAERERQARQACEQIGKEARTAQRTLRQLDQLVRQIDMSSATLRGDGEGSPADPWDQALRSQIIKGREEERVRLAREVHDGPAQVLANALMGLDRSRALLHDQRLDKLGMLLDRMYDSAREGLAEVRRFIADLRPGRLEEQGLAAALHDYIQRYRDAYAMNVTLEADVLPRLGSEVEIVLYRIAQEALQNAHKHARGARVLISLVVRRGTLYLAVRDEGPGFDPHEVARRAGRESWGLTSMRERAELIGARMVVTARPNHGTELVVSLPLERHARTTPE